MDQILHKRAFADIPIFYFDEVESTQEIAKSWVNDMTSEKSVQDSSLLSNGIIGVFVANHQNGGKGRRGRRWESKTNSSLLCSYVIKSGQVIPWQSVAVLNLATCDVINGLGGNISLKWPNDLMCESGKKLGGCLTEIFNDYLVVGIGVNINNDGFSQELKSTASSLEEIEIQINRDDFIDYVIDNYRKLKDQLNTEKLIQKYAENSFTIGKQVRIDQVNQSYEGKAEGVRGDGSLLVRGEDGNVRSFIEGDVKHLYFLDN